MPHPLVSQLRFARREFQRCLKGVSLQDGITRVKPMNSISWIIGHLASQEHRLWIELAQGINVVKDLHKQVGYGQPPSTPPLDEIWDIWKLVIINADKYLDTLIGETMSSRLFYDGNPINEDIGKTLLRNIFHYWFHLGEAHAVRQTLGHENLPDFVGDLSEVSYSI